MFCHTITSDDFAHRDQKKMVVQIESFKHICFKMFLIESFKSSSFRMTLPFVVHNSSVFAFLGFFNASAAKALPETMILQQPASWMTGIAVLRVHKIVSFFPMQRTIFPQFSLQHWKEHRGKNSRNCRKMMKNASLGICRVFWEDDSLCFCYISHPGQQQGHQQMRKSTWRPTCLWTRFKTSLCAYIAYI